MKRTQINLDEKTYYQLISFARKEKISLSGAIRTLVSKKLDKEQDIKNNPVLGLVELGKKFKGKMPKNLSSNIDYYLYGEGSPKFGKKKK